MNGADDSNEVSHKHFEDVRPVLLARWDDHDRSASSICLVGSTDPEQLDGLSSLLSQQLFAALPIGEWLHHARAKSARQWFCSDFFIALHVANSPPLAVWPIGRMAGK
ncbi:hypothetical protein ACMGT0_13815 [Pseudomonas sp. RHF3.3-3]|uniref:hypothetical protein n=1 Tax=Pseudomonas sp. RHF3.3-3 TaxID=3396624 RepID=UPI003A88C953